MTKHTPTLGDGVAIDPQRLLVSRLLAQANSGGGKSWLLRRLLEQTHGLCQQIVLDVEGEFHTLREKFARRWFQKSPPASFPHYDIAKSKRELAIGAGAVDCDRETFVAHMRRLRPVYGVYGPGNPAPVPR